MLFLLVGFVIFLYLLMMWKAEKYFPLAYFFLFTYFIQYVFSTYLIYYIYPDMLGIYMNLPAFNYFIYAIPALLALFIGVFIFNKDVNVGALFKHIDKEYATKYGYFLIIISYAFDGLGIVFQSISSIVSFTYFLKFVGAFALVFSKSKVNYVVLFFIFVQLLWSALRTSVFMDFLVWTSFLFLISVLAFNIAFLWRSAIIILAIPLLFFFQSVKSDYRQRISNGNEGIWVKSFVEVVVNHQWDSNKPFLKSDDIVGLVGRLTEGWHLGMTLQHVPSEEPFAYGKEMLSDIIAAITPRLIFKNKKLVGSHEKFYRFTGYKIPEGFSMSIGLLGDFYVNFGKMGSLVGLFLFGAFISRVLYWFMKMYVVPNPLNIVWIPFLFTYLVRANNDLYIVLNSLFKGLLIFLFITYVSRLIWPRHNPLPILNA